jgi:hypothetical protein
MQLNTLKWERLLWWKSIVLDLWNTWKVAFCLTLRPLYRVQTSLFTYSTRDSLDFRVGKDIVKYFTFSCSQPPSPRLYLVILATERPTLFCTFCFLTRSQRRFWQFILLRLECTVATSHTVQSVSRLAHVLLSDICVIEKQSPWPLVRERTLPTVDRPLSTKFNANFCR